MKVFKFHPPYKANGRTAFPETKKRAGVYLIKENGKLVYIGFSGGDLYATLYHHFTVWNDKSHERVTYVKKMKRNTYTVRVVICSPTQAARLEKMLIIKHQPRDNSLKYENYTRFKVDFNALDTYEEAPVERVCPF